MDAIRGKISDMGGFEPIVAAIVKEYKLTRRETDMLHCLRRNMTNAEIASTKSNPWTLETRSSWL